MFWCSVVLEGADDCSLSFQDVEKQQQMAQLTKAKDKLMESVKAYKCLFDATNQLIKEMKCKFVNMFYADLIYSFTIEKKPLPTQ